MLNGDRPAQIDMAEMKSLSAFARVRPNISLYKEHGVLKQSDPANLKMFLRLPRLTSWSAKPYLE